MMPKAVLLVPANLECQAFADGLKRHGWSIDVRHPTGQLLVTWGVKRFGDTLPDLKRRFDRIVVLERGYIGDRMHWTSVSFGGGLNNHGIFRGVVSDGGSRLFRHHPYALKPTRDESGYALLCGQMRLDQSVKGIDYGKWLVDTALELIKFGWTVRYRPHPLDSDFVPGDLRHIIQGIEWPAYSSLDVSLRYAGLVVAHSSNSTVDAALAGYPVCVGSGGMAWPISCGMVSPRDVFHHPRRRQWAEELAWKQWTAEEMRNGECWERVQ